MTVPGGCKTFSFWEKKNLVENFPPVEESLEAVGTDPWCKDLGTTGLQRFVNSQGMVMNLLDQALLDDSGSPFPPRNFGRTELMH